MIFMAKLKKWISNPYTSFVQILYKRDDKRIKIAARDIRRSWQRFIARKKEKNGIKWKILPRNINDVYDYLRDTHNSFTI